MTKHRGRGRRRAIWPRVAAVAVAVAVVVALAFFVRGFDSAGDDGAARPGTASGPARSDFASPTPLTPGTASRSGSGTAYVVPHGPTVTLGADRAGLKIDTSNMHTLTARVTSSAPLYAVGYLIPTSLDAPYGKRLHPGRTWSVSTDVAGRPSYAVIWVSAGASGAPATCTIIVDGKVRESRTTTGPYGRQVCYA